MTLFVSDWLSAVTGGFQLLLILVHRVRTFRTKELQRVIAKYVGVGKDFVIGKILLMLIDRELRITLDGISSLVAPGHCTIQHPFQVEGVVI